MTFAEVFHLLRVSRSTATRMMNEGQFPPFVLVGRSKRWRWDELQRWLEKQQGVD